MASCNSSSSREGKPQVRMLEYSDSLWQKHKSIRALFHFKRNVVEDRQTEMKQVLQKLKFIDPSHISSEELADVIHYESVYRVYKDVVGNYTNTVLEAEDLFYIVRGLEKQVKKGAYDNGVDDIKRIQFKKEYDEINNRLTKNFADASFINEQLTSVEPAYQRVSPKIDVLMERLESQNF